MIRRDPPQHLVVLGADTPVGRALVNVFDQESPPHAIGLASRPTPDAAALASAFAGARAVVDIADAAGTSAGTDLRRTVTEATRSVVAAAEAAGVGHLVFVSSAGLGRSSESEHFTARVAAERVVEQSAVQHTIVRTTQLFESVRDLSRSRPRGALERARLLIQPIAAWDVADALPASPRVGHAVTS